MHRGKGRRSDGYRRQRGPRRSMFSGWRLNNCLVAVSSVTRTFSGARPTIPRSGAFRFGNHSIMTGMAARRRRSSVKGRDWPHLRGGLSVKRIQTEGTRADPWLAGRIGEKDGVGWAAAGTQGHVTQVARPRAGGILTRWEVGPNKIAGAKGVVVQPVLAKSSNVASRSQRDWYRSSVSPGSRTTVCFWSKRPGATARCGGDPAGAGSGCPCTGRFGRVAVFMLGKIGRCVRNCKSKAGRDG